MRTLILGLTLLSISGFAQDKKVMTTDEIVIRTELYSNIPEKKHSSFDMKNQKEVDQMFSEINGNQLLRELQKTARGYIDEVGDEKEDDLKDSIRSNKLTSLNVTLYLSSKKEYSNTKNNCKVIIEGHSKKYADKVNEFYSEFKKLSDFFGSENKAINYYQKLTRTGNFGLLFFNPDTIFNASYNGADHKYPDEGLIRSLFTDSNDYNERCNEEMFDVHLGMHKDTIVERAINKFNDTIEGQVDRIQDNIDLVKKKYKELKKSNNVRAISSLQDENINDENTRTGKEVLEIDYTKIPKGFNAFKA